MARSRFVLRWLCLLALLPTPAAGSAPPLLEFLGLQSSVPRDPEWVAVSPDGAHVYVVGNIDDAVAVFARSAGTGALTPLAVVRDGIDGVDGLEGARSVTVSPDGIHVYVASTVEDAVAAFRREPATGLLTPIDVERDGVAGVAGLDGAFAITVSADGRSVYVASIVANAVVAFARDVVSGVLTFVDVEQDGVGGTDGLFGALDVAVSPDGGHVYAVSLVDDALVAFSRDPSTGALSLLEIHRDGVAGVDGLDNGESVVVSPDGAHVYAAASGDHAVTAFRRDPTTGRLTFLQAVRDGIDGVDGLNNVHAIAVSPDGFRLVAAGSGDDAVVALTRDVGSGLLTFADVARDGVAGVDGLRGAEAVAVSPDAGHVYVASTADDVVVVFGFGCGDGVLAPGEGCDDGNAAPGDGCEPNCVPTGCGDGSVGGAEECDDGNVLNGDCCSRGCRYEVAGSACSNDGIECTDDRCDGLGTCTHTLNTGPCDDGSLCTRNDTCVDGVCAGEAVPAPSCRAPTVSRRGSVLLRTERLSWLWVRGEETPVGAFGDPTLPGGTSYELCFFDASADPQPRFSASVPPGGACGGQRCWRTAAGGRLDYDNALGGLDGLSFLRLKPGASGRARVQVRGTGPRLSAPSLPFVPPVVVQLHSSEGECWEAQYSTPRRNEPGLFRARVD
jgi:cysteine-rich repeat protein